MIPTFITPAQKLFRWIIPLTLIALSSCQPATAATPALTPLPPTQISTSIPPSATQTLPPLPSATPTPTETPVPLPTEVPTEQPTPAASDLFGVWERISDEHGNEYLFFGEDGGFVYAEGNVGNVENNPTVIGNFVFENGIFTITTEDCPDIAGTYTIRLIANEHLRLELVEDGCEGREDGLTFQPWQRYTDY